MSRHIRRSAFVIPLLAGLIALGADREVAAQTTPPDQGSVETTVVVLPATGIVDSVLAGYLEAGIDQAQRDGAAAVVVQLNTPGGSLDATQKIVSSLLDAPLPVVVWVAPSGARAASAGTFITLAGHVAVMAPGTNIGAASPVGGSGEDIEGTLGQKVLNDAIASIRSIAETRGRNVDWAEETVRDARSSPASEALSEGAIDGIVGTIEEVIAFADGREVDIRGQATTIATAGATADVVEMNPGQALLHLLSDPNIAFILFTLGFYGLLFELQSPNFVTGIIGALAIVLAFIGFGSLPLNVAGLLLIGLAAVLFILEFTVTSHGLLTIAGIICFALGASALYTAPGTPVAPVIEVDPRIIVALTAVTAAYMLFILTVVVRWRRNRLMDPLLASTGPSLAQGALAEVRTVLAPLGVVYAGGEEWSARAAEGLAIPSGATVRIVGQDGLTLIVEPIERPG